MKILLSVMLLAAIQFSYAQKESFESRLKKNSTIKDFGLKKYIYSSKDLPHVENKSWNLVCQMPYNCHFQMWIELEGNAGDSIKLNSSNPLVRYLTPTESFVTSGGHQI